ncbi:protein kinase [Streptomyces sp. TRM70350]|uniref:protein kinase n=1 Tax=Streptomyces sp. TRM70350 TaxID=2856165 RepID=UPI001C443F3E|nr:protein kinase [Streptomyces sp. TRM70350]MBV7697123.1 protein kinase [Streptomyces sp. TRM70350]
MDDYAGRVLADRYRLPLPPSDEYELTESRAFDTYSGQEVLVRQVPLPEVVEAEVLDAEGLPEGFTARDRAARRPSTGRAGAVRRPTDPAVRRAVEAAQAAAAIPDHPRLDQVFDVFAEGGSLWVVSELVAARPLAALLAEQPLTPYRAAEVASDVLMALRVLHAHGWVHRNITARTVLVCDDGRVMLTGLAVGAAEEALCGYDPVPAPLYDDGGDGGGAAEGVGTFGAAEGRGLNGVSGPGAGGLSGGDPEAARRAAIEARAAGGLPVPGGDAAGGGSAGSARRAQQESGGDVRAARAGAIAAYRAGARAAARVQEAQQGGHAALPGARPASEGGTEQRGPESSPPGRIADPYGVRGTPWHGAGPRNTGSGHNGQSQANGVAQPGSPDGPGLDQPGVPPHGPGPAQPGVSPHGPGFAQPGVPSHGPGLAQPGVPSHGPGLAQPGSPHGNALAQPGVPPHGPGLAQPGVPSHGPGLAQPGSPHGNALAQPGSPHGNALAQPGVSPHGPGPAQPGVSPHGPSLTRPGVPPQADGLARPGIQPPARGSGVVRPAVSVPAQEAARPARTGTRWDDLVAGSPAARRGPATALAAERARQARMAVVGPVTERWAPEQAGPVHENWQLAPPIGPATDLWALGALLFRAVQGHAPYPEESTAELVQLVCAEPPAFAEECGPLRPVVESLLRQDPTERLDFEELRGWLRSLVRSAPEPEAGVHVVPAPPPDASRLPIVRRKGELVRRRRAGLPARHGRHKRGKERTRSPRSLGRTLLLLILLALAGAIAYAMLFMPKADRTGEGSGSGATPGRTGAAGQVSQAPAPTPEASSEPRPDQNSPDDDPTGTQTEVADGFTLHDDPEGFRVAVAEGWQRAPKNGSGQVVYSQGDFELIVVPGRDSAEEYGSDPMTYQKEREPELRPYRESSWATSTGLKTIEVGGRTMAEGQFTWSDDDGRDLFVRNLAMLLDGRYHVLQVRGPEAERDEVTRLYEQAAATYQATG